MKNTQLPAHARVVKAHGAGNSFVVATDQYDDYDPSEVEVATLCSPAFGIGADGFIRAVEREGMWFMDYRNADGSKAEMCGTGCCAAALATALRRGPEAPTQWVVDIPGGTVIVGLDGVIDWEGESPRITDASVFLTGPATRVAEIRLP